MTTAIPGQSHIWHPFTQMKTAAPPIHIVSAKGTILQAAGGVRYIDAIASWWVNLHGHAHPQIAAAIAAQATTLEHTIFAGFTHTPAIRLADKLISLLPAGFARIFFSDNGSTAVEVAIKMALQYWHNRGCAQRSGIIAFENAYHGDTFGAMSAGARSAFSRPFDSLLFDVCRIAVPQDDTIDAVKASFRQLLAGGNIAAFIFEPLVQGAGGMRMHRAVHLDQLLAIAAEYRVPCIADEVMTGFGRTGKTFAVDYLCRRPDIICLSKGITGGFMPLAVTACSQEIYDAFYADDPAKTFFHGHSYTANPLACAAALASLELLGQERSREQIQQISCRHAGFAASVAGHSFVRALRQQGTILAIDFNTGEATSYFNGIRNAAAAWYMQHGVLLRPLGNTVYILPPYCITTGELDTVYRVIAASLDYLQNLAATLPEPGTATTPGS